MTKAMKNLITKCLEDKFLSTTHDECTRHNNYRSQGFFNFLYDRYIDATLLELEESDTIFIDAFETSEPFGTRIKKLEKKHRCRIIIRLPSRTCADSVESLQRHLKVAKPS